MSLERDHSHDSTSTSHANTDHDDHAPGRASRSALLRKPDHAVASGLLSRKARDANGVAEGADSAVAAASSSSGSALPETLMRKFESSLGADLSGVRIHTGSESAAANDAVGARAYTMGNDIHFGAGQYDPSSSSGQHLIAHEVAHTVQQAGGAQRRQFKLEVSTPHDALEYEADRAADAMVVGAPTSVTGGSTHVHRKEDEKYDPSGYDVAPLGDDSSPREIDWRKHAKPVYTDLGTPPPEIINPKLTYDVNRASAHPEAVKALDGVGNACFTQYGELSKVLEGFRTTVAAAEKAATGASISSKDPMNGLDNSALEGGGKKLGEAFKDNQVNIIDKDQASLDAASQTEADEIQALKKAVDLSGKEVRDAEGDIATALDGVADAKDEVQTAANGIAKADNDIKKADNAAQATALESEKSNIDRKVKAFTSLVSAAKGLADLKGKEKGAGATQALEATFDLVVSSQTVKYDRKLEALKTAANDLEITNASLAKQDAVINYNIKVRAIGKALRAVDKANTAYKKAVNDRISKYNDLSTKIEAAMLKNGVPAGDAARAKTAIKAIPLIEETLGKLKAISGAANPPEYSVLSGQGASMCTNIGMVLAMVGLLKGYKLAADSAHIDWSKRLTSVNELLGAAKKYV